MKLLYSIILVISFAFCNQNNELTTSNEVLIVLYPNDFNGNNINLNNDIKPVKFSKELWDYFIVSHPRVAMTIFGHHLYAEHYPYLKVNDTLFGYYPIGSYSEDLSKLLSDNVGGTEKTISASGTIWKNGVKYNPQSRPVSDKVALEFDSFKRILSFRDEQKYYVLIYRKSIVQSLFH